jgi:hypothetical protein
VDCAVIHAVALSAPYDHVLFGGFSGRIFAVLWPLASLHGKGVRNVSALRVSFHEIGRAWNDEGTMQALRSAPNIYNQLQAP